MKDERYSLEIKKGCNRFYRYFASILKLGNMHKRNAEKFNEMNGMDERALH